MPNIAISIDRVKMLLRQNKIDLEQVPINLLRQAVVKTSSVTEMRGDGLTDKLRQMAQFGMIREVRSGIWKIVQ